jgi:hypothetical protein
MSAGSLSETATKVLVPERTTGSFVCGAAVPAGVFGAGVADLLVSEVPGAGVGCGCGVDVVSCFCGERRLNTGRSASSGALAESLVGELLEGLSAG